MPKVPDIVAYHPAHFAHYCSNGKWTFEGVPHLGMIANALRDVAVGKIKRLLIQSPPRHGKSLLVSQYFPAWYIGASRSGRVILCSYESNFAASWGRKARDVLEEHGEDVFGVGVSQKSSARDWWELDGYGGAMMTAGVGAGILGRGADCLVIDDPVKNAQEALSKTYRERAHDWYASTALTRLEPGGAVVLIMQRWHHDDLAGRLLANEGTVEEGGDWTLLNFPALAEEGDILGREIGEPLWPERFGRETLLKQREANHFFFEAQYQQRPQPLEGGLFQRNWIRNYYPSVEPTSIGQEQVFYLDDPEIPTRVRERETSCFFTVDLATSQAATADYTVISVFRTTPNADLLVEDVVRKRLPLHDQIPLLMRLFEAYRPYAIYMEKTGYQLAAVQASKRVGLPVIGVDPRGKGPKEARAIPAAERMRSGKIYLRGYASWRDSFIEELVQFPTGKHDDQVDTLSMAAENVLLTGGAVPYTHEPDAAMNVGPYTPRRLF